MSAFLPRSALRRNCKLCAGELLERPGTLAPCDAEDTPRLRIPDDRHVLPVRTLVREQVHLVDDNGRDAFQRVVAAFLCEVFLLGVLHAPPVDARVPGDVGDGHRLSEPNLQIGFRDDLEESPLKTANPICILYGNSLHLLSFQLLAIKSDNICKLAPEINAKTVFSAWFQTHFLTAIAEELDMFFVIMRTDGAYNPRENLLIRWNGNDDPMFVASFDSFPNRREAWAMIHWRSFPEAENNLAVLMWRHQCDRLMINPFKIRFMLERAAKAGVPEARQNLEVLRAHMPEAWD